jgi:hypothetical protein
MKQSSAKIFVLNNMLKSAKSFCQLDFFPTRKSAYMTIKVHCELGKATIGQLGFFLVI